MTNLPATSYQLPPDTPEKAPMPTFDPRAANYFDMFAPQFFNLETVQALMREGGGPLLLEVDRVVVEYVYNPERGEDSGDWKPVVYFVGGEPALVINQTRAKVLMNATGSIHVADWHRVGWLEVSAGIDNGRAQIIIAPGQPPVAYPETMSAPSPNGDSGKRSVDEINDELFGERR